jgi:type IV secretory pathway TraG/TraD family ATPase VirD4
MLWFGKDAWTVRDACEGCLVLGQTGSGKTSGVGKTLAKSFLNAGYGMLILCSKKDETELWRQYCRETNRTNSLIIFGPDHPYRFNILNFEYSRPGSGAGLTQNLVSVLMNLVEMVERQRGQGSNKDFWQRASRQMLTNCIDLVTIAKGRLLLQEIYDVLTTAPSTLDEVTSESWRKASPCWHCVCEGRRRKKSSQQEHDFEHAVAYWTREYPALADRTRSIIVTSLTSLMDVFLRGTLRELFCTKTNIVPEMTFDGAIIVLDLNVKEFGTVGQLSQTLFKLIWQRACERRDVKRYPRPVVCWQDEGHFFATATDADFQSTARSSRVISVLLSQNIGSFYAQLGQFETNSLMGNLGTKILCSNGDVQTNQWSAELFSKSWQLRGSTSIGTGRDTVSRNYAASESIDFEVLPSQFTSLAKGGPENNWCVEAIAFQGGRIWNETNKRYIKVAFAQR